MHELRQEKGLSSHFKRHEFACKCGCGFSSVDAELLSVLENLREFFGKPITITSACRCATHNANVGGSPKSAHRQGIAADIVIANTDPEIVYHRLDMLHPQCYGIGKYDTFTHIDVRKNKARW